MGTVEEARSRSGEEKGEPSSVEPEAGMVWATLRKKSSMYDSEVGSYYREMVSWVQQSGAREAYIYWVRLDVLVAIHVATFWEQAIWKQRQEDKLG